VSTGFACIKGCVPLSRVRDTDQVEQTVSTLWAKSTNLLFPVCTRGVETLQVRFWLPKIIVYEVLHLTCTVQSVDYAIAALRFSVIGTSEIKEEEMAPGLEDVGTECMCPIELL